jgi:ribosomal protein L24
VSTWIPGQLYVVSDSPKTIAESLTSSLYLAVKEYIRVTDAEREAVQRSRSKLPNPAWVRITKGKYKDDVGRVFKSEDDFVQVLIATRDFPYKMPKGSRGLLERSRLRNNKPVSDIVQDGEVVGCTYNGESYYKGLLLKNFHRDLVELIASPHVNDIRHHLEAGWDVTFLKNTVLAFSIQYLRVGDWARVVKGHLRGEVGQVVSTDHMYGSAGLEFAFDGCLEEVEIRLEDIERIFRVGDTVKVVAGPYLGLEGHVLQMNEDVFHVCQDISKEVVSIWQNQYSWSALLIRDM